MIDPKAFMKFFAEEFGVKFVEAKTGRNAIEVVEGMEEEKAKSENRTCAFCRWVLVGDGSGVAKGDLICGNDSSEYLADWVSKDRTCKLWEVRNER